MARTPSPGSVPLSKRPATLLKTARWLVVVSAAALPLVASPATADPYFLPKLAAARVGVVALLLALGIAAVTGRLRLRRTPLDFPLAFVVASALASTILAINANLAFFGSYTRYEGFLTILLYALLFWLGFQSLDGVASATLVLRALLGVAFVVSLFSILQVAVGALPGPGPAGTGFSFQGFLRGYGTFGNPNALGAFLAMLLPVAVWQLLSAATFSGRLLASNVAAVTALGLVMTFSRSAWVGAGVGVIGTLVVAAPARFRWVAALGPIVVMVPLIVGSSQPSRPAAAPTVFQAAQARLLSLEAPLAAPSMQFRLHVWADTLGLIASRPIFGYGPDTFGRAYPRFETGYHPPGLILDRAHSEPFDVAATQGLVGLAAYATLLVAIVRAFWKRRHDLQSVALLGGVLAYAIYLAVNFSYLPAALPFWIFLAAAVTVWMSGDGMPVWPIRPTGLRIAGLIAVLVAVGSVNQLALAPYRADATYKSVLSAAAQGRREEARALIHSARRLAPWQSTYAVAEGSLALDLLANGQPGSDADWSGARAAFLDATRLGTFNASAYRYLAVADAALGVRDQAIAAAQMAVQLNRFDPANQAELKLLTAAAS